MRAVGPARGSCLDLGPERTAFHPGLFGVAERRPLPPAEAVIGDGNRDRHVDADHADIDPRREFARGVAVAREDRDTIAILMLRRQFERGFEIGRTDDLEDGAEDFFLVTFHVGGDMVEQGRTDEERSEEHTSELQSLMSISYAVYCLKNKK